MKQTLWSPLHLELVLHHYCSSSPWRGSSPVAPAYTNDLIAAGLLIEKNLDPGTPDNITITPRGKAFVDILCQTPIPVQRWADPRKDQA
jgi:hypothetical protein